MRAAGCQEPLRNQILRLDALRGLHPARRFKTAEDFDQCGRIRGERLLNRGLQLRRRFRTQTERAKGLRETYKVGIG